jgi:hypothetical protein
MGVVAGIGTVHHSCSHFDLLPTRHGGYGGGDSVLLFGFVCGLAMAKKTKGDKREKFKLGQYSTMKRQPIPRWLAVLLLVVGATVLAITLRVLAPVAGFLVQAWKNSN